MNPEEWNRLATGLIEDALTQPEQERLKTLCREHPGLEDELVRSMVVGRLLPLAVSGDSSDQMARAVLARLEADGMTKDRPAMRRRRYFSVPAVASAALILLGLGGWAAWKAARPMGYLSRSESLVWIGAAPLGKDGRLPGGSHLRASSGLAEVELSNGARLVLEGPFDLELTGYKTVTLHSGRLAARCPPSARGFTILTPRGEVVDLGTELGVRVEEDGNVEAHVLTGSVEVAAKRSQRRISLFDGEAVRLESQTTRRVVADPSAFVTMMPLMEDLPTGFIHWSMDENQGATAADSGHGLTGGTNTSLTLGAEMEGDARAKPPRWTAGLRGSALAFDGLGSYAESTYRGIEGALPRTVALWIRVPDPALHAGTGILSWGSVLEDSAWQISLNWSGTDGPVGRLRLGTYAGRIVGTTDLRDGQWHHIAVVMYPPSHPEAAVNVLLYVDGRLEPMSVRSNFRVNTNIRQAEHGVSLGRHVSFINDERKFFHGEMDDVFIFGRPLVQEQILKLIQGRTGELFGK